MTGVNQKERMLAGLPYKGWLDGLEEERTACKKKIYRYNQIMPGQWAELDEALRGLLGRAGKNAYIEPPFRCDYGWNIEVGDDFYANYNLTVLDVAKVTIGDHVMLAPNVSIYTAGHPLHPDSRNSGYEYGIPVTIGDNVWIGGNVVILPGVTIGSNAVIGAGSVVSKDIPAWSLAVGNPCRVIRKITEEDRKYYYKDRVFDVEDY
jgi:acetyltransferase-like isoleucine patch superfamily enzyme